MSDRTYIAIDLKSFYASVECLERGLDPMDTNLVVADPSRTEKTICLAVSPSLKEFGIPGRPRLFEVIQKVKMINAEREVSAGHSLTGSSWRASDLRRSKDTAVDYLVAPPQMALYMKYSTEIYQIYLKYISDEDIHVYSIDEVFMDVTGYLHTYGVTAKDLASKLIKAVQDNVGITATAGIGTNLYLAKIAMDIEAKHCDPDENGVRIAELDEYSYRDKLWDHRPLTDFWRVGRGYARRLESIGIYTMGDIAKCSIGKETDYYNEDLLYDLFGKNAELLIDHAWGWEPCTMEAIKQYKPESNSMGAGQVLPCPYPYEKARLVLREMADALSLDLAAKDLVTDQLVLTVDYDRENITGSNPSVGEVKSDRYGRKVPKPAHGTENLGEYTCSTKEIMEHATVLFERITNPLFTVRKIYLTANRVKNECDVSAEERYEQLDLFTDYAEKERANARDKEKKEKEKRLQKAILEVKGKYGKNALLRGMSLEDGATAKERNGQIGGHKA